MQLKPIGARVLIKPYIAADKTSSGLYMETNNNTAAAPVKGEVVEAGDKSQFKKGDTIWFRRYAVDSLKIITSEGEKEVNLVDDEDCLCLETNE